MDTSEQLLRILRSGHDALAWKVQGLEEYDARRPLTPTGTNLLGLLKHVASVELGYFGEVFDRDPGIPLPWMDPGAEPNADMWLASGETREQVEDLYAQAWQHTQGTIAELDLDAAGHVPWWGEHGAVTLQQIIVHVIAEVHRHAGHADILREQLDGTAGLRATSSNLPDVDQQWWAGYHGRLEQAAREATGR